MHTVKLLWIFLCIFRWIYDKMLNPDRGLCCSPIHSYILELAQRMNEQLNWIANQSESKASRKQDYSLCLSVFTISFTNSERCILTIRFKCISSMCTVNLITSKDTAKERLIRTCNQDVLHFSCTRAPLHSFYGFVLCVCWCLHHRTMATIKPNLFSVRIYISRI